MRNTRLKYSNIFLVLKLKLNLNLTLHWAAPTVWNSVLLKLDPL